ncbi:MAG: peptidylprolyl isomerase [Marinobacter sp.]
MDYLSRLSFLSRLPVPLGAIVAGLLAVLMALPAQAEESAGNEDLPKVRVSTTEGAFTVRLRPDIAPETVDNFLRYVEEDYYDGTIFHRVIPGFMIQGGGFDRDMNRRETRDPIVNESRQSVKNLRGTLAMARTQDPDSATAQFFVNLEDNPHLDTTRARKGYAVFGDVTEGMSVVDAIGQAETTQRKGMNDVPREPVIIESIRRVDNGQ